MKNSIFWGICFFTTTLFAQEPLQCQDAVIALDENGEATITSSDVLVNMSGKLFAINWVGQVDVYALDLDSNTIALDQNSEFVFNLLGDNATTIDINPINNQVAILCGVIFAQNPTFNRRPEFDSHIQFFNIPETNGIINDIDDILSIFSFLDSPIISYSSNGDLYLLREASLFVLNVNGTEDSFNLIENLEGVDTFNNDVGLTYDFDNNRLIISTGEDIISLISFDLDTLQASPLFTFNAPGNNCNAKAIEYVGSDTIVVATNSFCDTIYTVNLVTQEVTTLAQGSEVIDEYVDIVFVEDQVGTTTFSDNDFSCENIGENEITVSYELDGETITCESIITIIDPISSECPFPSEFILNAETGETTVTLIDYRNEANFTNSCGGLTITQNPPIGTIFNVEETIPVTITAEDENGNQTFCEITVITDFSLSADDFTLESSISIYPNPTTAIITLTNRNNIALTNAVITDVNGRVVQTIPLRDAAATTQLSLDTLSNGLYFVRINTENASLVKRVIKN